MKNMTLSTKQIKEMKEKSFRERALVEIKQAVREIKKGVYLF